MTLSEKLSQRSSGKYLNPFVRKLSYFHCSITKRKEAFMPPSKKPTKPVLENPDNSQTPQPFHQEKTLDGSRSKEKLAVRGMRIMLCYKRSFAITN